MNRPKIINRMMEAFRRLPGIGPKMAERLSYHILKSPLAEVNDLLERRLSGNPLVTIHKYPGADHAFARKGGKTYAQPESERALALTVQFFDRHLAG